MIGSFVIIGVSLLVIIGWLADIEAFKSIVPGFVTMKMSTATAFLLIGIGTAFHQRWKIIPPICGSVILFLTGQVILAWLDLADVNILNLDNDPVHSTGPGEPSIGTFGCFFAVSLAMIFSFRKVIAQAAYVSCVISGTTACVGYAFREPKLYFQFEWSTAMALHTAVGMIITAMTLNEILHWRATQPSQSGIG